MTTTTIINGVTVGSGATTTQGFTNVTKTALQAGTTAYNVAIQLTNGALAGNLNESIRVYTTTSPYSYTAALAAADTLSRQSVITECRPHKDPSGVITYSSPLLPRLGGYNYTWVEEGTLRIAATLTVDLCEVP